MVEEAPRARLKEKLVFGSIYSSFFVLVFLISAYHTFPYDRLRDLIVARVNASSTTVTARNLQIGELQPLGWSGVRLKDVEFTQGPVAGVDPPSVLRASELAAQVSLWSLLFGTKKVELHAKLGVGHLDAKYAVASGTQHVEAEFASIDVSELGLGSFVGLPLKGKASGTVDMNVPAELDKAAGTVKLEIKGLHIGDGKAKVKVPALAGSGLTLDEIDAGKLELGLQLQDGLATVAPLTTNGRDLKVSGKGTMRLADPLRRSRPDLTVELTFSSAYKNKSDRAKAMFEIIGMRPEWQHATTPDGTLRVHVGGTLQAIRGGPAAAH